MKGTYEVVELFKKAYQGALSAKVADKKIREGMRKINGRVKMRDLTEEELKLAPDWATHYDNQFARSHPVKLCFCSDLQAVNVFKNGVVGEPYFNEVGILDSDREIPIRKPFDIREHELFKSGVVSKHKNGRDLHVNHLMWDLDKDRAIAIAKALGVTAEDLRS